MIRRILFLLSVLLLFPMTVVVAQWTRLPVFAGHADRLVQNKYKPNEIFAVVQNGGIYKSADYGDTWTTLVNDLDLIWHSESPGELAFEVAANGDCLVSTDRKFYRSLDGGRTWQQDNRISGSSYYNDFITHIDGTLFFDSGGSALIMTSADSGKTIDTIRTPLFSSGAPWLSLLIDPEDSKRIILSGGGLLTELQLTTDGGLTWSKNPFPSERSTFLSIDRIPYHGGYSYMMWVNQGSFDKPVQYMLFRSNDSGRTWYRNNTTDLFVGDGSHWRYPFKAMYFGDTYLFSTWNALYISRDAGVTWASLPNRGVWDMVRVPQGILASSTFDGIRLSADTGVTWRGTQGTRAFPGSAKMEVAVARQGVVYATVHDNDYLVYTDVPDDSSSRAELLRSSDGGDTWETLFESFWLDRLTVRHRVDERYYVVANRNTILSGTPDQRNPDTLIALPGGVIREIQVSEAPPYEIVALLDYGGPFSWIASSDGGQTWRQHGVPGLNLRECRILPSSSTGGEYAAILRPIDVNNYVGMGIWRVTEWGNTWRLIFPESALRTGSFSMCTGNQLYWEERRNFSTDFGANWSENLSGLDAVDRDVFFSLYPYGNVRAIKGGLLTGNQLAWFWYRDGIWRNLNDVAGKTIARLLPNDADFNEHTLYAAFQKHGLYRTTVANLSTLTEPPPLPVEASLACYPNPTTGFFILRYRLPSSVTGLLQISDVLGNIVYERDVTEGEGSLPVDFKIITSRRTSSGLYFIRLIFDSGHSISTPILYIE